MGVTLCDRFMSSYRIADRSNLDGPFEAAIFRTESPHEIVTS